MGASELAVGLFLRIFNYSNIVQRTAMCLSVLA